MDSPVGADSPVCDRNPSPPPELRAHPEMLSAECIGNTAFSKHWLFTTLIKLIEEVNEESKDESDLAVDVDDDLQNELCKLWDMSMNSEVAVFLDEFKAVDIMSGIIEKSKAPRVIEICVGILGNMACEQTVCQKMAQSNKFINLILLMMETRDVPTLVENTRLLHTSLSNSDAQSVWAKAVQRSEDILGHLKFIFSSSTNCDLLKNTAEIVDTLLDLEQDLCVSWATDDFIHSLLEATEQIGSNHSDALEVYLHIFQSFSTTESGVEALVSHLARLEAKILKYLNIVCEYEIVGVDGKERPLASALSVLNILLLNQSRNNVMHLCNNEKLMRILLKILEPLYPMLQNYKVAKQAFESRPANHKTDQTTLEHPSDSKSAADSKNGPNGESDQKDGDENQKSNKEQADFTEEDEYELRKLSTLYDILAGYLLEYCSIVFMTNLPKKQISTNGNGSKGDKSSGDSETKGGSSDLSESKGDNQSEDSTKEDNSEKCSGDSQDDSNGEGSKTDGGNVEQEVAINCVPILTYLDESCSRWRINNLGLVLKQTDSGFEVFRRITDLAQVHNKERVMRIFSDIQAGKIVTRAESTRDLPEDVNT